MASSVSNACQELAHRLAQNAEAVCRHYLSNGRRAGRYWLVGNVDNAPGRSLYVRLCAGTHGSAAGKWTDAATGEHGDLLDLIAANRQLTSMRELLAEARAFLHLPGPTPPPASVPGGPRSPDAARRLWCRARPIAGTLAETYLQHRGLEHVGDCRWLRFHPSCWYRSDANGTFDALPALIAAVTDIQGRVAGLQRTWLDASGTAKAAVTTPRRAMGRLLGNAVRIGETSDALAAGEGIETMLSLRQVFPTMPVAAALSANHLAALSLPPGLCRLYIVRDRDAAGWRAAQTLVERARAVGIAACIIPSLLGDLNDDLCQLGRDAFAQHVRALMPAADVARFRA